MISLTSVDTVWAEMNAAGEVGGSRRIDAAYVHDIFCTLDAKGRYGVFIITAYAPEQLPLFDAMDILLTKRIDERIGISITLLAASLLPAFVSLCDGLLAACEAVAPHLLGERVVSYLISANSLLEYGDPQVLGVVRLRGLLGELIVIRELLSLVPITDVVAAWTGPLRSAQDFVFSDRFIETKAKTPISNTVTISSVEQLDPATPSPLILAVVTISSLQDDLVAGITPNDLVNAIRQQLKTEPLALLEFDRRLRASNYFPRPYYEITRFRLISLRYYKVELSFPRLRQVTLQKGILSASYELDLSECEPFETTLEDAWT
jgi:hypothetical protein